MTFIDWSDPEEMFGLLQEYVADAKGELRGDGPRRRFLARLSAELDRIGKRFDSMSRSGLIERLRTLHRRQPGEFADDPVLEHLADCIEELERIESGGAA